MSDMKLGIVATLVETWYDDDASPQLIACVPTGFRYVEKARPRKDILSTSTNYMVAFVCVVGHFAGYRDGGGRRGAARCQRLVESGPSVLIGFVIGINRN